MNWKQIFGPPAPKGTVQTAQAQSRLSLVDRRPLRPPEAAVYEELCRAVPLVAAALEKIIRLCGGFRVAAGPGNRAAQAHLDRLYRELPVGASQQGLEAFAGGYLRSLLLYGSAVGEMVLDPTGDRLAALYLPSLRQLDIRQAAGNPLGVEILAGSDLSSQRKPLPYPQLILFSALDPGPGEVVGRSLLAGLPFLADILTEIFRAVGNNFRRIGSLRYAVTYKPGPGERGSAPEIAREIAREWSAAMSDTAGGEVRDFVAVGEVDIRVIGADNQYIDTQVPVRQILEQMVAKLGIPPFLLGLSWSTTERMSRQQADILTSELESYRNLLTPVLERICKTSLALAGLEGTPEVLWDSISLQDEAEMAAARLSNAQAARLESRLEGGKVKTPGVERPPAGLRNGGAP